MEKSKVKLLKPTPKPCPLDEPGQYKLRKFGVVENDDHRIFIHRDILHEINEYSHSNLSREVGGVLIGGYYTGENGRQFIEIDAYVPARLGESRNASFKFTHDAWSEIGKIREEKFPDRPLVGWHHTHPSFGIFLSGMDMHIHTGFFNLPWQVALVVDPVADKLGFFQWKQGKVVLCGFHMMTPAESSGDRKNKSQSAGRTA